MVPPKPNPLREPDFTTIEKNQIYKDGIFTQSMVFAVSVLIVIMFGMMSATIVNIKSVKTDIHNLERLIKTGK